ncbi:MAG: hypothetical protein EOM73_00235 [Bacteroidia bacterium]|nr:hypothetical protein [Bacteroidia bacterium]
MKNKKLLYNSLRYFCLVLSGILLSSYGNERSHRSINQYIVESFVIRYSKFEANLPRFKNYMFNFDRTSLPGDYISRSGLFHAQDYANFIQEQESYYEEFKKRLTMNISGVGELLNYQHPTYEEERGNKSAKDWIIHGGYSADVPEVHASLRHFYDPTKPANKRYLTDKANNAVMKKFQSYLSNPEINGVDWALGDHSGLGVLDHNYSWESGKKYIQGALQEADPAKRSNYMAKAWRSLGETLHMIADNGCPPHVRNDAHPLGNVDTYEEMVEQMDIGQFRNGSVPGFMKDKFNDKNMTARKIAHELAVFTNENFVSNETISGTDWKGNKIKQTAHPADEYKSPKISASNYEKNYYTRKVGETSVKLCTDSWYFGFVQLKESYPFVDEACVKSQANVLIPTIIEAGTNAMKWFIPELKVVIHEIDEQGNIEGEVIHTPDNEYKTPIKYNGPVYIQTITLDNLASPLTASNGKFSGKIGKTTSPVFAEIEFGGVTVRSENMNMAKANPNQIESVQIKIHPKYQTSGGYLSIFNNHPNFTNFEIQTFGNRNDENWNSRAVLNPNNLTVKSVYTNSDGSSSNVSNFSARVVFNKEKTMITSLIMTEKDSTTYNLDDLKNISTRTWFQSIELHDIPVSVAGDGDISFSIENSLVKKHVKSIFHQEIESFHGETKTKTFSENNLSEISFIGFTIHFGSYQY